MAKRAEFYKDPYGCTASIAPHHIGFRVKIKTDRGDLIHDKIYSTYRGAKVALGKVSEGMMERTGTIKAKPRD